MRPMRNPFLFVFLLFAINSFSQKPAFLTSDKPGWHRIGELTMTEKPDTAEIEVIGADAFAALQLKVEKGTANIYEVDVIYEDGSPKCFAIEKVFKEGQQTAAFDLKGGNRNLRKIAIVGKSLPSDGEVKAQVQLSGFKRPEKGDKKLSLYE
jgi:hypothetical protein